MKRMALVFGILLLSIVLVSANEDHEAEIEAGRRLVESDIACDELTEEQLEAIGEYLMEQMHPGEAHEAMHEMMGMEEGTEYHMQVHVNMARMMYCGEGTMMGGGMMGPGMMGGGMMGPGMMQGGMMGNNSFGTPFLNYSYWSIWDTLYLMLLVGLIALVSLGVFKLWKDVNKK